MGISSPKFCIFGRKFSERLKYREAIAPLALAMTPLAVNIL